MVRSPLPPPVTGWAARATESEPTASLAVVGGLAWSMARSGPEGALGGVVGCSQATGGAGASVIWVIRAGGALEAADAAAVSRRLAA